MAMIQLLFLLSADADSQNWNVLCHLDQLKCVGCGCPCGWILKLIHYHAYFLSFFSFIHSLIHDRGI